MPAAHYLESWGDTRSYDGTVTIMQPLIEPLYEGKTAYELLAVFSEQYDRKPYDIVKSLLARAQTGAGVSRGRSRKAGAGSRQQQPLNRVRRLTQRLPLLLHRCSCSVLLHRSPASQDFRRPGGGSRFTMALL